MGYDGQMWDCKSARLGRDEAFVGSCNPGNSQTQCAAHLDHQSGITLSKGWLPTKKRFVCTDVRLIVLSGASLTQVGWDPRSLVEGRFGLGGGFKSGLRAVQ